MTHVYRDKDEIHALLAANIHRLIPALFPEAHRGVADYRVGDTDGAQGSSLSIASTGPDTGKWYDHAKPEDRGDLFTLIGKAHAIQEFPEQLRWACRWLGISYEKGEQDSSTAQRSPGRRPSNNQMEPVHPSKIPLPLTANNTVVRPANDQHLSERQGALMRNEQALTWLYGRQLTDATIRHFRLGLYSHSSKNRKGLSYRNALSFPLLSHDGLARGRYLNSRIPQVTTGLDEDQPEEKRRKDWAAGKAATYWATPSKGRQNLLIVEGPRDAWRIWQEIQDTALAGHLAIITSTHGSAIPKDWQTPSFFTNWERIYLGQDADDTGDALAQKVAELAHQEAHRLRPPDGNKDWTDWLNTGGGDATKLITLLETATLIAEPLTIATPPTSSSTPGDYAATAVEINGAWVNGRLYYPYRVLSKSIDEKSIVQHQYETRVLRSDGEAFSVRYLPAPPDTPVADRVLALTDGTIVRRHPVIDADRQSFRLPAINRYRQARKQGKTISRPPTQMALELEGHLRSAVLLPYDHDYTLLALTVMASYLQRVFAAVPLILINGVAGSGKSELASRMAELSANGVVVTGQTSAATIARVIDRTNGLVAFDDLEAIGQRSKGNDFSQLIQQLKVSYKQSTSRKSLTVLDRNGARIESLDFFGIKVMTNTTGVDEILGSRLFVIHTRKVSASLIKERIRQFDTQRASMLDLAEEFAALRDELHIWAMEHAQTVHQLYQDHYRHHTDRADEIAAPLRTIAAHLDDAQLTARLEEALHAQLALKESLDSDTEILRAAATNLVKKGYFNRFTLQQLIFEMELLVGPNWDREFTTEIPTWKQPRWVGRTLRGEDIALSNWDERSRLYPGGHQTRVLQFNPAFVEQIQQQLQAQGAAIPAEIPAPKDFCRTTDCQDCEYQTICPFTDAKRVRSTLVN